MAAYNPWGHSSYSEAAGAEAYDDGGGTHVQFLLPGAKVRVFEPTQDGGGMTVLPLPALASGPGEPPRLLTDAKGVPYDRLSTHRTDLTNWLIPTLGIRRFGVRGKQQTVFVDPSVQDGRAKFEHPYMMIREAAWAAHHAAKRQEIITTPFGDSRTDKWASGVSKPEGDKTAYVTMPKPESLHLFFALVYNRGRKGKPDEYWLPTPFGAAPEDDLPAVLLTSATASRMLDALAEHGPQYDPSKVETLKWPRVTSTAFLHFYDIKSGNCPAKASYEREQAMAGPAQGYGPPSAAANPWGSRSQAGGFGGGVMGGGANPAANQLGGYTVFVSATHDGTSRGMSAPTKMIDDTLTAKLRHPADVFRRHTHDELVKAIHAAGYPDSLLWFAFQNRREWMPERLRDAKGQAAVVVAPGPQPLPTPQGGWGQPAAQPQGYHPQYGPAAAAAQYPGQQPAGWGPAAQTQPGPHHPQPAYQPADPAEPQRTQAPGWGQPIPAALAFPQPPVAHPGQTLAGATAFNPQAQAEVARALAEVLARSGVQSADHTRAAARVVGAGGPDLPARPQ